MSLAIQPFPSPEVDPESEADAASAVRQSRQPHLGSTLLVLAIFGLSSVLLGTAGVLAAHRLHLIAEGPLRPYDHPLLTMLVEMVAYAMTAVAAWPVLRAMWKRPVSSVIEMNWPAARQHFAALVGSGLALALVAQLAAARMSMPKDMPIDNFFHSARDLWIMAFFGTFIAPIAEEVFFRGFLLRTIAIAFDWTRHFLGKEERRFWQNTSGTSRPAWIVGAIFSSALFAVMHAKQLGWAWNAVVVLLLVGLVLAAVRIRMRSVWASSLLHMGYNGFLFLLVFFVTDGFRHLEKLNR